MSRPTPRPRLCSHLRPARVYSRGVERARLQAESRHLEALVKFAERAYRRQSTKAERDDLVACYAKLRKQDDLSHEEAARSLGIPLGTVKTHILRAKAKLRALLDPKPAQRKP